MECITSSIDTDYQVMHQLNLKTLVNFCVASKYTQKLCNDINFWTLKFKNKNLPLIFEVDDFTFMQWVELYCAYVLGKHDAINSLLIYDIQYNDGLFYPDIYISDAQDNLKDIFRVLFNKKYMSINNIRLLYNKHNINNIVFITTSEGMSEITLVTDDIIKLLSLCYLHNVNGNLFNITCENNPFITNKYRTTKSERIGILKTILYYTNKNELII